MKKYFSSILVLMMFAACPSKHENATATMDITSDTANATSTASPGGSALVPEAKAGTTVLVTLNDNSIAVGNPDAIPPGPAVFTITNAGKQVHNLFVDGPGVQQAAGDDMIAGATHNMNITLAPGTYTLYCPILDHRQKGEELKLIIKPPNAPAPSSTTANPPPTSSS
jgi:plastocyanin